VRNMHPHWDGTHDLQIIWYISLHYYITLLIEKPIKRIKIYIHSL
jgi:hypothetical protein